MGWRTWNNYEREASRLTRTTRVSTPRLVMVVVWLVIGIGAGMLIAALTSRAFAADAITGTANVIDGDTIQVGSTRIRLHGIDAPEAAQTCMTARGDSWNCGADALGLLYDLAQGKSMTCQPQPKPDKYSRTLAVCSTTTHEINAAMVCRGMAWSYREYSADYAAHEEYAKKRKVGIWQADTTPAWEYRKVAWDKAVTEAPLGRPIVGIKRSRLYHTPWSPYYRRINLKEQRGKEFFADEAEALKAGYAPPQVRRSFVSRVRALVSRDVADPPPGARSSPCG